MENFQQILNHPITTYMKDKTTNTLSTNLSTLKTTLLDPYIITPLSNLLISTTGTSDLFTIALLLAILYISLRLLDYARRVIMWWVSLIVRLVLWSSVVLLGLYVYNVGVETAVRDLGWAVGLVMGFAEDFQHRANAAAMAAANPERSGYVSGRGNGNGNGWGSWS